MAKTLTNIVKKTVASVGIATALVAGALTSSGCNLGLPLNIEDTRERDSPLQYSEIDYRGNYEGCKYIGEVYRKWDANTYQDSPYGYGTFYSKNGKIVYQGYYNMGQPVSEDPLNGRRVR